MGEDFDKCNLIGLIQIEKGENFLRYGIMSVASPGIAGKDSFNGKVTASKRAMLF